MTHFAQWLAESGQSKEAKRKQTGWFFLSDTTGELATAATMCGLSTEQYSTRLQNDAISAVEQLPALGLYREALYDKTVNSASKWEDNDLTDLFYLSCAAGYADHVVCEREAASVLRQGSRRLKRNVAIHRSLQELVCALALPSSAAKGSALGAPTSAKD
jgi:hypothetical protein